MVAIVAGNGLGLFNTSLGTLGVQSGNAGIGRSGATAYVNAYNGNVIVQNRDEILISRGLDVGVLRTYNSQAQMDGDNNDNWRLGVYRGLSQLIGTVTIPQTVGLREPTVTARN